MITVQKAIRTVAERTYDNKIDISQKNKQRRYQVTDLYGIPFDLKSSGNSAYFYASISGDKVYLERFQFKLDVKSIANNANVKITVTGNNGRTTVDVTPYLKAQQDGDWIDSAGLYPDDKLPDEPIGDEAGHAYDLLEAACDINAEAQEKSGDDKDAWEKMAKAITASDFKKITISADSAFEMTCYLYLKYSHVNR